MTHVRALNVAAAYLLLGILSVSSFAQGRAAGPTGIKKVLLGIPNLTTEQRKRIEALTNVARMQSAPLREQVSAGRKYIASLWAADVIDRQAVARKQAEVDGAVAKLRTIWAELFVGLHDILTASQRTWLSARAPAMYSDVGGEWAMACDCRGPAEH